MPDLFTFPLTFDPDIWPATAIALRLDVRDHGREQPFHCHRKGQLVLALRGSVTCTVEDGIWMVPPQCGVWIPPGLPHSNRVSDNGRIGLLFVEPGAAALPAHCCTLSISPLLRELIEYLAGQAPDYPADGPTGRLARVLLEQLVSMPAERLYLPVAASSRLRRIADALIADPSDRRTVAQWAAQVALSERSLARLALAETGMTFGRWRRQLHLIVALQRLSVGTPVQLVSQDLGYESVSAFITMFRKALGRAPTRYMAERNLAGNRH